jgi:hypothetical protein
MQSRAENPRVYEWQLRKWTRSTEVWYLKFRVAHQSSCSTRRHWEMHTGIDNQTKACPSASKPASSTYQSVPNVTTNEFRSREVDACTVMGTVATSVILRACPLKV